jgi:hypothetical protein
MRALLALCVVTSPTFADDYQPIMEKEAFMDLVAASCATASMTSALRQPGRQDHWRCAGGDRSWSWNDFATRWIGKAMPSSTAAC